MRTAGTGSAGVEANQATTEGYSAALLATPALPTPDPNGISKCRFISFSNPNVGPTAILVTLTSLHHVDPPYTGGLSTPFTLFEGQSQYVGPPTQFVESASSGMPLMASALQCAPHYQNWSTIGLLNVTGEAIVPSSIYDVQIMAAECLGDEEACKSVSSALTIETARWGDIVGLLNPLDPGKQPDFADIGGLVNKFVNAPGAPIKAQSLLTGDNVKGLIDITPDVGMNQVAADVDAFKGLPYPYKPGKCTNNAGKTCASDEDCTDGADPSTGSCVLCGDVSGGACCHGDGTCDALPASVCNGPNDTYKGDGSACSRCCGPGVGCAPLTDLEWFEAESLWPNLDRRDVCREAEATPAYNCIAWTIDVTDHWIWDEVDMNNDAIWDVSDFTAFYAQHQKSAVIYGDNETDVLHAAKPLPNNCASSKAGEWIRLRHDRNQIEGGYYGNILATYSY